MTRLAAVVLAVFGLLPIANWIAGGHEAPWYGSTMLDWSSGLAMLALAGVLGALVLRRFDHGPETEPRWARAARRMNATGWKGDLTIAGCATVLALGIAWFVFSARPLLIDEIIQVFQARLFASGRLWMASPLHPEFTSATHLLDLAGRRFGQFPPGWSLMMAPWTLIGAVWMAGPLATGAAVLVFARLLRRIEPDPATRTLALLLLAASPFVLFLGASHMNHMPTLLWLLVAALGLSHLMEEGPRIVGWGFVTGLGLGIAATIRPLDAAAFGLPTGAWLCWLVFTRRLDWRALVASGLGVVLPVVALLWYNGQTTGDPFTFGYIALWGPSHALGFHDVPWGVPHTPARGLELINLYLMRLQSYMFELPIPGLLPATVALAVVGRIKAMDRWLIVTGSFLLLAYFAYWHDGNFLGPRFVLPLAPLIVLWTARLPRLIRPLVRSRSVRTGLATASVVAVTWALAANIPLRATQYANGLQTMRWDAEQVLGATGVTGSVLVRESWGAELVARLRTTGIDASQVEHAYNSIDSCVLDGMLDQLEASPAMDRAGRATRTIAEHVAGSDRLVPLPTAPDTSLRYQPGTQLTSRCIERLEETRAGFTLLAPLLLSRDPSRFSRDLHARDTLLFRPGEEPRWLLVGDPTGGAGPRLIRIDVDSMRREWRP